MTVLLQTFLCKVKGHKSPVLGRAILSCVLLISHANPTIEDKRSGGVAFSAKDGDTASVDSSVAAIYAEVEAEAMVCRAQK